MARLCQPPAGRAPSPPARLLPALALAAGLLAAGARGTEAEAGEAQDGAAAGGLAFVEVAPGNFVHLGRHEDMGAANAGDVANGGFIVGERAVAVIDPGGSVAVARALERAIAARTELPVEVLVLTHFHPDHVLGASVFADVPIRVAHVNYARAMTQRGRFYLERFAALADGARALPAPTREIAPGESITLDLGHRPLALSAFATAHSDNDLVALDVATATLWAGDLVFEGRTPALDGSLAGWLAAHGTLAATASERLVPGHGEPGPPAPMLARQRRYLERLAADVRAALDAGEGLADVVAAAEHAEARGWALFALQHPTNVTRAYTELEWE